MVRKYFKNYEFEKIEQYYFDSIRIISDKQFEVSTKVFVDDIYIIFNSQYSLHSIDLNSPIEWIESKLKFSKKIQSALEHYKHWNKVSQFIDTESSDVLFLNLNYSKLKHFIKFLNVIKKNKIKNVDTLYDELDPIFLSLTRILSNKFKQLSKNVIRNIYTYEDNNGIKIKLTYHNNDLIFDFHIPWNNKNTQLSNLKLSDLKSNVMVNRILQYLNSIDNLNKFKSELLSIIMDAM
jgi:hypothetical protein